MVSIESGTIEFDEKLLDLFDASEGAYSVVTPAEDDKGHITTAGAEDRIIRSFFGESNIHVGPKKNDPVGATKSFYLFDGYDGTQQIGLTVNCPKPEKSELHIYMQKAQGFRPRAGDVWFVFTSEDKDLLTLGSMTQTEWLLFKESDINIDEQKDETEDAIYQEIINKPASPKTQKLSASFKYPRNPTIVRECMVRAGFKCEVDNGHQTFISKATGRSYIEGHHLVPLAFQNKYKVSLDVHANIAVLCPNCHRAIHYADGVKKSELLKQLFEIRESDLAQAGIVITIGDLISLYE